jgi:hypothetical protein
LGNLVATTDGIQNFPKFPHFFFPWLTLIYNFHNFIFITILKKDFNFQASVLELMYRLCKKFFKKHPVYETIEWVPSYLVEEFKRIPADAFGTKLRDFQNNFNRIYQNIFSFLVELSINKKVQKQKTWIDFNKTTISYSLPGSNVCFIFQIIKFTSSSF